jgi:phosphatidylglycerophosphatase A
MDSTENHANPRKRTLGDRLILAFSSGGGLGYLPKAPGTFGTLFGIPMYLALAGLPLWGYTAAAFGLIVPAIWAAARAEAIYGGHDNQRIVIDEAVGLVVAMIGTPPSLAGVALGFVLFRLFDIFKPWPCRVLDQRVPGGTGVVLDDVAAGLMAAAVLAAIRHWGGKGLIS